MHAAHAIVWLIAAGCGRIGFAPQSGTAVPDGPPSGDATCAVMAIGYVQGICNEGNGGTTISATLNAPVTVGNTLVVAIEYDDITIDGTASDSLGHVFRAASVMASRSAVQTSRIWYVTVTTGGTDTITVTLDANPGSRGLHVHEYEGIANDQPLDAFAFASGTSATPTTTAVDTTLPGELLLAHGAIVNETVSAPGSGFTSRDTCHGNMIEDSIAEQPGSHEASFVASGPETWLTAIAAFRPAPCP